MNPTRTLKSLALLALAAPFLQGCGGDTAGVPTHAAEPAGEAPAEEAAAPASTQTAQEEPASPWQAEVLDTGVDLSGVRLAGSKTGAPAPAAHEPAAHGPDDGHDHGDATAARRAGTKVFTGGAPDPTEDDGQTGFLTVAEDSAVHDFGKLTQGDKVSHTFELQTSGGGDVTVAQIKTSCGCTLARTQIVTEEGARDYELGTPLAPGSRLSVEAVLDTKAKRGAVRSVITVLSSDRRGNLQLQLMATVTPFFEITPPSINFGSLRPDSEVTGELTITSQIVERFRLTAMTEQLPDELGVELTPVDPDEDGLAGTWKAAVKLGPGIPEGPRRNYQVLFTSDQPMEHAEALPDGGQPMHQVHAFAYAQVVGLVSASPHYMSFGLMRGGQEVSRTVRIENADEAYTMPVPEPSVRAYEGEFEHPDAVSFEVVTIAAGKSYDVTMTMRAPDGMTGTFRGLAVIPVGHPTRETLELPFTGVVRPAPGGAPEDGGSTGAGAASGESE